MNTNLKPLPLPDGGFELEVQYFADLKLSSKAGHEQESLRNDESGEKYEKL